MTPREFYDTVVKMRYWQKEYFRQTEWNDVKKAALAKSKQFERAIDIEIERVTKLIQEPQLQFSE